MADKATIIVHSGDMDKVYSALIIGNGALAMGMDVSLYFTFWGLQRLQKGGLEKGAFQNEHGRPGQGHDPAAHGPGQRGLIGAIDERL